MVPTNAARTWLLTACLWFAGQFPLHAQSEGGEQIRPATGTVNQLPETAPAPPVTTGDRLDQAHDWFYEYVQHWLAKFDTRFGADPSRPLDVPVSPLRIGVDSELLHESTAAGFRATPDLDIALHLQNIEQRLKLFISSADVSESPTDPTQTHNPIQAGLRFTPLAQVDLELGVRAKVWPAAFTALRWNPQFDLGPVQGHAFAKAYVESGRGFGLSSGAVLESWRNQWLLRSASYADWVRNSGAVGWSQSLIAGHVSAIIRDNRYGSVAAGHDIARGAALSLMVSGDRISRVSMYEAGVILKRPLHGSWLFGYVEPLVRFERTDAWHPDFGIGAGFDALFWGLAARP
jgi:hypothetical protein